MIVIDLDGTLLSPQGKVTQRTRDAVHLALNSGWLVCFATGRNFTESRAIIEDVGHYSSAVFVGGAMVIDTKNRTTMHRQLMEPALAREVCAELESAGHAVLALQDTSAAGVDYVMTDDVPLNESTVIWMRVTTAGFRRVKSLADFDHAHTVRVGIVAASKMMPPILKRLEVKFGERIYHQSVFVPAYDVEVLEVFDPSVNKWEGIKLVAKAHNVDLADIIAIGDDVNDLHMIKNAGLGVAMGNARPAVLAIAKKIIGSNANDGLAVFLEELVAEHAVEPLDQGT